MQRRSSAALRELFGSQPDPGTGYAPSGNDTYDEATVICEACEAEATACHDLPACWDYAVRLVAARLVARC